MKYVINVLRSDTGWELALLCMVLASIPAAIMAIA